MKNIILFVLNLSVIMVIIFYYRNGYVFTTSLQYFVVDTVGRYSDRL